MYIVFRVQHWKHKILRVLKIQVDLVEEEEEEKQLKALYEFRDTVVYIHYSIIQHVHVTVYCIVHVHTLYVRVCVCLKHCVVHCRHGVNYVIYYYYYYLKISLLLLLIPPKSM